MKKQLKPMPDWIEINSLNDFAKIFGIERKYYGDSLQKPCDGSFYSKSAALPGWYEDDDSLEKRIISKQKL